MILYLFQNKSHTYEHDIQKPFPLLVSPLITPPSGGCSLGSPFLHDWASYALGLLCLSVSWSLGKFLPIIHVLAQG